MFCPSDRAEEFLENYAGSIFARVIIFGNSDRNFEQIEFKLPKSIKGVFLQNALFQDDMFKVLPIGLENLRSARNGLPQLFDTKYSYVKKQKAILIGPFGFNHSDRDFINALEPNNAYEI